MSLPGSSASSSPSDAATQSRIRKGKGRAVSGSPHANGHDAAERQDYGEALRAALADDESQEAGENGGQGQDNEATFIYNGLDDEDTQDFIRDASLEHTSYQERLRGVLEGDESEAPDSDDAVRKVRDKRYAIRLCVTDPISLLRSPPVSLMCWYKMLPQLQINRIAMEQQHLRLPAYAARATSACPKPQVPLYDSRDNGIFRPAGRL